MLDSPSLGHEFWGSTDDGGVKRVCEKEGGKVC